VVDPVNNNSNFLPVDPNVISKDNNYNKSFAQILKNGLNEVNQLQVDSDQKSQDFALGKIDNVHDVTIATEKAKLALNLTLAIQNKVVDAYNKVMRMQI
jgi:flagellar hook-basal body complex protein FliE